MNKCDYCQHVEMCGWQEDVERQGCEFFDDGNKWIPVSERLPKEWESVLVCFKTQSGMAQAVSERFDGDRWSALCGMKPIAWMPLPEPWQKVR